MVTVSQPATEEHETPSEGFWQEFFLLKPDPGQFRDLLESMTAASLIENQVCFQKSLKPRFANLQCR